MFRKLVFEIGILMALSILGAAICWAVQGGPEPQLIASAEELPEGYIRYEDAAKLEGVIWVDARSRELWQRNGQEGSVFLTDHPSEDWDSLMAEAFETLATGQSVVVYCATEGCGSSEPVAQKIQELGLIPPENIYVLAGGWKSLK